MTKQAKVGSNPPSRKVRKPLRAFACVGTHGHPYYLQIAGTRHPECEGRYEIYYDRKSAEKNALTKDHVVEVEIHLVKKGRKQ